MLNIRSVPLYAYSLLFTFFFSLSDLTYNFIVILFIQPIKEQYNRCYDPQNSGNGRKWMLYDTKNRRILFLICHISTGSQSCCQKRSTNSHTGDSVALKKYIQNMLIPVNKANIEAERPLLFVSRNTIGKQAAPIIDGIMIKREYTLNSALSPSTYVK